MASQLISRYPPTLWLIFAVILLLVSCKPDVRTSPLSSPLKPANGVDPVVARRLKPAPGTGIIIGVIKIEHTDQPMAGVELYLARHIGITPDTPMYSIEPESAPRATVEDNGWFIFTDVPPGRYAIVVWNPLNSFLVRNPVTGSELVVDVQPDQVHNVGILFEPLP